ncbi:hypothetical protein COV15_03015 [Candidatus Woesearchaeota archaeon CG10_big_fil_rev_8_21_14_0_10_34_12]|nr:MAG: hypothetical protein COV15_03015 [Candidatus Woesearchaeota archaeon CG10_big_fil_rev_8_21_14_0_10_34_12]
MDLEDVVGEAISYIVELEERLKIAMAIALYYTPNVARDCKTDADYLHEVWAALKANGEIKGEDGVYGMHEEFLKKVIEIRQNQKGAYKELSSPKP